MTGTSSRIASFKFNTDARVWRLNIGPGPGLPNGYRRDVPEFTGNLRNPSDMEKIDMFLSAVGVVPAGGGWKDEAGGWVTPIIERRD